MSDAHVIDLISGFGRIVQQELVPEGIWTTYSGGERLLLPYGIDEAGEKYADLDPNKDIFNYGK